MLVFQTIAQSDQGLVRQGNEDSGLVTKRLVAVADGMGGHVGGEVASSIAIKTLAQLQPVLNDSVIDADSREDLLLHVTYEIDNEISAQTKINPQLAGMGTTLTALHLGDETVELLHVGDSRCYKYSDEKLTQLSHDHTVIQELLDQGRVTPEEAFEHPQRSLLTQVLMGTSGIDPVLMIYPAKVGDRFLLCSDGLSGVLSEFEIAQIIRATPINDVVSALVEETKAKGAPDNVTILWLEVIESAEDSDFTELLGAANE